MEPVTLANPIGVSRRYDPSANILANGVWRDGCNVLLRGTDLVPVAWNGVGPSLANVGDVDLGATPQAPFLDIAMHPTNGPTYVKMTTGSASAWRNNSLFFAGSGSVYFGSATPLAQVATGTLRVRLTTGTILVVGMQAPAMAPMIFVSSETSLKLTGTRSVVVWEANSITGWISNKSPVSNIATFLNKKMIVQFPMLTNTLSGADGWYVGVTPSGLGSGNAFYTLGGFITEASLTSVEGHARSKKFDFNDNELDFTRPAPVTKDPPPASATHVTGFDVTVALLGTYGGAGISPSDVDSSGGSYDPLKTGYAAPFEAISGLWPRPASGFAMFSTAHSLQGLYVVGGPFIVAVRTYWSNTGIPGGRKSACFCGQTFLAYTDAGPAMLVGDDSSPEHSFALPVLDLMRRNFVPAQVTVGWDPTDKLAVFCGLMSEGINSGHYVAIPYRLMDGNWGLPLRLPGQPKGAVTLNGKLYLMIGGNLVPWNTSGGSGLVGGFWCARTDAVTFQSNGMRVQPRHMSLAGNSTSIVARLYPNPNFSGTDYKEVASGANNQYGVWEPMNPPKTATHAVEFRGTSSGDSPLVLQISGYLDPQQTR